MNDKAPPSPPARPATPASEPRIALIAAVARNGAIGHNGGLLWHEPADQKHFRNTTLGHAVVMGRKTWDSLPPRFRPLPGRRNVVVSRQPGLQLEGATVVGSLPAALELLRAEPRIFVIGGGELYALALPLADELVLTEVDADLAGDTYFPSWVRERFTRECRETHRTADDIGYVFATYRRI